VVAGAVAPESQRASGPETPPGGVEPAGVVAVPGGARVADHDRRPLAPWNAVPVLHGAARQRKQQQVGRVRIQATNAGKGEAVHGVDVHDVTLPHEAEHGRELRPVDVFAGGLVGEHLVDGDAIELTCGVLVQGADPGVTDALPADDVLLRRRVTAKPRTLPGGVSINPITDPSVTAFVMVA